MSAPLSTEAPLRQDAIFHRAVKTGALDVEEAKALMDAVIEGEVSDLRLAALLAALEVRGPTPEVLAGFHAALSRRMVEVTGVPEGTIDTCGTGGSGRATLNTSTLAGLVAASAGATVAKHGNRSASGRCGSLDVLEALGGPVDLSPSETSHILREHRFCFVNARRHHPVLGRVGPVRKALGFRTVFNLLGPMLNPAKVRRQLVGVSDHRVAPVIAQALLRLGHERAWVVTGPGNLDEIALEGETSVFAVEEGAVRSFTLDPSSLGLGRAAEDALLGGTVEENARRFLAILSGEDRGPARDHVALNAGAALVVAGIAKDLADGLERAERAVETGEARALFEAWRHAGQGVREPRDGEGGAG